MCFDQQARKQAVLPPSERPAGLKCCHNGIETLLAALSVSPLAAQEVDNMNTAVEAHEGCHIYGWLDVQRVAGSLHISVHVDDYMMLAKVRRPAS